MRDLIRQAIEFAEKKLELGLLVWDEIPEFSGEYEINNWWTTAAGDRETVYSIAALYSQFPPEGISSNEAREILEDELCKRFPQFCD